MDVDNRRKLALLSRDPRAYAGSTSREPGEADPNGATNIAGVYVIDAKDPADLKLLSFQQLPTGHTTTCVNGCRALWTGGPASTTTQRDTLGWTFGRPIAHDFDVDGSTVAYAWYGEGTRFLDISDPANPTQFAYWRPDDGIVWASYMHRGYVYTADRTRGVDVLRLTPQRERCAARRAGGRRPVAVRQPAALRGAGGPELQAGFRHRLALRASGPVGRHQAQALAPNSRA